MQVFLFPNEYISKADLSKKVKRTGLHLEEWIKKYGITEVQKGNGEQRKHVVYSLYEVEMAMRQEVAENSGAIIDSMPVNDFRLMIESIQKKINRIEKNMRITQGG